MNFYVYADSHTEPYDLVLVSFGSKSEAVQAAKDHVRSNDLALFADVRFGAMGALVERVK
jgi:hypothetical protein